MSLTSRQNSPPSAKSEWRSHLPTTSSWTAFRTTFPSIAATSRMRPSPAPSLSTTHSGGAPTTSSSTSRWEPSWALRSRRLSCCRTSSIPRVPPSAPCLLERVLAHVVADLLAPLRPDRADDRLDVPEDEGYRRLVRYEQHRPGPRPDDRVLPLDLLHGEVLLRVEPKRHRGDGPGEDPGAKTQGRDLEGGDPPALEPPDHRRRERAEAQAYRQREARGQEVVEFRPPVEEEDDEVPGDAGPERDPDHDCGRELPPRPPGEPAQSAEQEPPQAREAGGR